MYGVLLPQLGCLSDEIVSRGLRVARDGKMILNRVRARIKFHAPHVRQSVETRVPEYRRLKIGGVIRVIVFPLFSLPPPPSEGKIIITWKLLLIIDRVALVSSGIPGCSACRHGGSPIYTDGKTGHYLFSEIGPGGRFYTIIRAVCKTARAPTSV